MKKRISISRIKLLIESVSAFSITLLGCMILFCGGPTKEDTLRWKTAIDIPVNLTEQPVLGDWNEVDIGGEMVFDLGTHEISMRPDIMDYLFKLTDHELNYWISVTNNTIARLTFHGLLFKDGDAAEHLSVSEFHNLLTTSSHAALTSRSRIRLSGGQSGLIAPANETVRDSMPNEIGVPLRNLIFSSENLAWRWILEAAGENSANIPTLGTVDVNLRIRVSGVNSFDSLFAM